MEYLMERMERIERLSSKHNFTNKERVAILAEYEACTELGEKSALCRRIGVSPNTVNVWARQKRAGLWVSMDGKQNSHIMKHRDRVDYERVKRENAALKTELARMENAVEVLGKASALLEALTRSAVRKQAPDQDEQVIPDTFVGPKLGSASKPRPDNLSDQDPENSSEAH